MSRAETWGAIVGDKNWIVQVDESGDDACKERQIRSDSAAIDAGPHFSHDRRM